MSNDNSEIEALSEDLPFQLSEEEISRCIEIKNQLKQTANSLYEEPPRKSINEEQASDPYNSLLAVYRQPASVKDERKEIARSDNGKLAGLSVAVKDNIAVKGLSLTCGLDAQAFVPSFDATVVRRLRQADAEIYGKANMDGLAFGPSGEFSEIAPVENPRDSNRVPGGSSSGSGVAVAAEIVDVALGTDTGGSVRIPAACCGVVGVKPTHGIVPTDGLVEFAPSLDTIGPLAKTVEQAEAVFDSITNTDNSIENTQREPTGLSSSKTNLESDQLNVGLLEPFFNQSTDRVSKAVREAANETANKKSVKLESVEADIESIEEAYYIIGATEFGWLLRQNGISHGRGPNSREEFREGLQEMLSSTELSNHIAARVLPSLALDIEQSGKPYVAAWQEVERFQIELANFFDNLDVLITPTLRSLPPQRGAVSAQGGMADLLGNTSPFNLTGMPAVSIPIGGVDQLISLQIIGPQFRDKMVLHAARLFESVDIN